MTGFCSECHKVWTLETKQGICQWCSKSAVCQTTRAYALGSLKSRPSRKRKQVQAHPDRYDQLNGQWLAYYEVASNFSHKARFQDRQDLCHDIIVRLAEVAERNGAGALSKPSMLRVASYVVLQYWDKEKRQLTFASLNDEVQDDEGNTVERWETLVDDKAIDVEAWLDSKMWLRGCRRRLVVIATKKARGKPLNKKEQKYLERYRQKELEKRQKTLF